MNLPLHALLAGGTVVLGLTQAVAADGSPADAIARAKVAFVEVTATAFPNIDTGENGVVPTFFSGGAAVGDCDGDGLPDVYFTGTNHDVLYRNLGNGVFEDVTMSAGLGQPIGTRGAAFADIDNDGDLDLYATGYSEARHFLFVNDGHCHFTEEAVERGVAVATKAIGRSVSFGDYDRDGYLDIFVTELQSYLVTPSVVGPISHLFRNRGSAAPGYFDDVTVSAGLSLDLVPGSEDGTFPFTGRFTDFDHDGWPDLAVASDFHQSRLFWNDGNGHFTDGTLGAGVGTDEHGMGATTGDFDGDGRFDLFVTSIFIDGRPNATGNRLFRNLGSRTFSDVTDTANVRNGGWGWGTEAFDYDNDGDLDLIMTNARFSLRDHEPDFYTLREFGTFDPDQFSSDQPRLWRNDGDGTFTEVSQSVGLFDDGIGQGVVTFDYDADGDLDVLLTHDEGAPPRLFRNDGGNANHWVDVELTGRRAQRNGVGAVVTFSGDGRAPMVREVSASSTYFAQNGTTALHFGLGPDAVAANSVRVEWPNGTVQMVRNLAVDATRRVTERERCWRKRSVGPGNGIRKCGNRRRAAARVSRRATAGSR